jgi:hypothetical protein
VGAYLSGATREAEFLKQAESEPGPGGKARRCQACFLAGSKHLLDGDKLGAKALFQMAVATDARSWRDHASAMAELGSP